jgi:hypothetical protein
LDQVSGARADPRRKFTVATLDFLSAGGSGYTDFAGVPLVHDIGILREELTTHFLATPAKLKSKVDGRWKEQAP